MPFGNAICDVRRARRCRPEKHTLSGVGVGRATEPSTRCRTGLRPAVAAGARETQIKTDMDSATMRFIESPFRVPECLSRSSPRAGGFLFAGRRVEPRLGPKTDKRGADAPLHFQIIRHRGACGKAHAA